jgi:hypothetical protein
LEKYLFKAAAGSGCFFALDFQSIRLTSRENKVWGTIFYPRRVIVTGLILFIMEAAEMNRNKITFLKDDTWRENVKRACLQKDCR